MPVKPVNLKDEREKRERKCPFCNETAHAVDILCPRVASVTYHTDEAFEVNFDLEWPRKEDKDED